MTPLIARSAPCASCCSRRPGESRLGKTPIAAPANAAISGVPQLPRPGPNMPLPYLAKLARKHGVPMEVAEGHWAKAKACAAEQGHADNHGYITAIAKKMMGESDIGLPSMIRGLI